VHFSAINVYTIADPWCDFTRWGDTIINAIQEDHCNHCTHHININALTFPIISMTSQQTPHCWWWWPPLSYHSRHLTVDNDDFPFPAPLAQVGAVGLKTYIWAFGPNNTHDGVHFRDPTTRIPTQYILNADYAPLAFRKSAWKHVGGIDETMSEAGEWVIFGWILL
jgi:hypothetical protein